MVYCGNISNLGQWFFIKDWTVSQSLSCSGYVDTPIPSIGWMALWFVKRVTL